MSRRAELIALLALALASLLALASMVNAAPTTLDIVAADGTPMSALDESRGNVGIVSFELGEMDAGRMEGTGRGRKMARLSQVLIVPGPCLFFFLQAGLETRSSQA